MNDKEFKNIPEYETQLKLKTDKVRSLFEAYYSLEPELYRSPERHYRMRAEFRIWHEGARANYAMIDQKTRRPYIIESFPPASDVIQRLMPPLLEEINRCSVLSQKLFTVEFLSTTTNEALLTLIYHRPLDEDWLRKAKQLESNLGCKIIGRSRKKKLVLSEDFVTEKFDVSGRKWTYQQIENSFTQPNAHVNQIMLNWVTGQISTSHSDLLELYCGNGNFTLPLSTKFRRILTTEISKTSIRALKWNLQNNEVLNIDHARLSAEEMTQALDGVRPFRRLAHLDLESYNFSTLLVDPPRAGLDPLTEALASRFDQILYVSCNPNTLLENMRNLSKTHSIASFAMFDQFPFTPHLECGVLLKKK